MRKVTLILMLVALAVFVAVPAFACDGHKTASAASKACAAACDAKMVGKDCPSHPGCICPGGMKITTAMASRSDNVKMIFAGDKSCSKECLAKAGINPDAAPTLAERRALRHSALYGDNDYAVTSVDVSGGCTAGKATSAGAKTGHSCTMDMSGCMGKAGASSAKLANGHPVITVAEAMKCEGAMVAFLSVDKMTCNGCVSHITKTLGTFDGVCAVDVDLKKASATVVFHADKVKTDDMVAAINKAGYVASMKAECTDDMRALFGDNYKEKCLKSCANACKEKQEAKKSSES